MQRMHEGIKLNCDKCEFKANYDRTLEARSQSVSDLFMNQIYHEVGKRNNQTI